VVTPDNEVGVAEQDARDGALTPLTVAFSDYDRTRPLLDGRVKVKGVALTASTAPVADFCRQPVYQQCDAAEMSFSWYLMARERGENVIALPIFPLRMSVWAYVFVRKDSPIVKPSDLIGKRIGSQGRYNATVNLWLRGLFKEHYGLSPEQVTWVMGEPEGSGFVVPENIPVEIRSGSIAENNLKEGVVDAITCVTTCKPFRNGEKWIRRLFPNAQAEMHAFVKRTGINPITHVLVMNRALAQEKPWIAENLYRAFVEAQRLADETYQIDPKRMSLLDSIYVLEQQTAAYGSNPYVSGVEPNRKILETLVRYGHEQGYIRDHVPLGALFVPGTLGL
jgi:4,5-dihydroxyphthalate decarboxylase